MKTMTDEDIALQVQQGDIESFGLLVERYERKMTRYGRKFLSNHDDVKDLVQNIFIKAYINIQGFDANRKFSPWLYRIAHNEFINEFKKKKREPLFFVDFDIFFPHPVARETTDKEINEKAIKEMIESSLDKLDSKYREPLVLYYFEEMSYQEITEILKIPISTVGIRLQRGKIALKKIYNNLYKNNE